MRLLWPAMAALLTLALQGLGVLTSAELLVRDALLRTLPAKPAPVVAVVLIDDAALRRSGPWPWDRAQLAHLVDRVAEAGAKGVVLDLLLPESRGGDDPSANVRPSDFGFRPSFGFRLSDFGSSIGPGGTELTPFPRCQQF